MSLPQRTSSRKPRRVALWAPFALVTIAFIALSFTWFWLRDQVERRMESLRAVATASGWAVDWNTRGLSGYPFRLDLTLNDPRVREPSGWGLAAAQIKAEAFVFAPKHWVVVIPDGVVLSRPRGGALHISAKALRASLSDLDKSPPRLSVEGLGLTFSTARGSAPFLLRSASEFHLHMKSGPDDQGAAYIELDQASADLTGLLGRIASNRPVNLVIDGIYSNADALSGASWPSAARRWGEAGGRFHLRRAHIVAGAAMIDAARGDLGVGSDGRLTGELDLVLHQAPRTLTAMGEAGAVSPDAARALSAVAGAMQQGPTVSLPMVFQAGRTTLGPLAIGPSPRIY